jgi:hypothetical protein
MGVKQSKQSCDISSTPKKNGEINGKAIVEEKITVTTSHITLSQRSFFDFKLTSLYILLFLRWLKFRYESTENLLTFQWSRYKRLFKRGSTDLNS